MNSECFQGLYTAIGDGLVYTDTVGRILKVNPAFCSIVGFSESEMRGRTILDFTSQSDREEEKQRILACMNSDCRSGEYEKRLIHREGRQIPLKVQFWVDRDEKGVALGMWSVVRNMTSQRAAEEQATRSRLQYLFMTDNAEDVIWAVDQTMMYTYISPSVERLRGFTPDEVIGSSFKESMTDASFRVVSDALARGFAARARGAAEIVDRFEIELRCKDGGTIWVESVAKAMLDESGVWIGIVGSTRDISDRKRMEEKLKESQQFMRALLDAPVEAVGLFSTEGTTLVANMKMAQFLGTSMEAMSGQSVYPFFQPQLQEIIQKAFDDAVESGESIEVESVHSGRIVAATVYPLVEEGVVSSLAVFAKDVTDVRFAEETRKKTQEKYKLIVETANEGILGMDADQRITYANAIFADFIGCDVMEIIGQPLTQYIAIDEHTKNENRLALRKLGERARYDCKFRRKDGVEVWGLVSATPLAAEDGSVLGAFAMVADITDVKQAHQRLITILDGIDADIFVSDLETNEILFMNAHLDARFGPYQDGLTCHALFYNQNVRCQDCPKPRLLDKDGLPSETVVSEKYNPKLNIWSLNHDRTIEWLQGQRVHMHMGADITELKTIAEELQVAIGKTKAASLAKNEFLANMSHEIRTPLNGLLGMLQLLQLSPLDDDQSKSLNTALGSGRNLLQILNDILDISKVESGKLELEEQYFELGDVLDSVVSIFKPTAEKRGVNVSWAIDESLPRQFMADKGRLRQILFNLVGNATKFTEEGAICVEAYPIQSTLDHEAPHIFFRVKDTGIGIPEEKIDNVFDPFTQADGSITRKYQGTGLGLGIVHRLVLLMGGTISVSSEVGKGTVIAFTIKAKLDLRNQKMHVRELVPKERKAAYSILVAEDERVNQLVVQRLLEKNGHSVRCVFSGEEAVEVLQTETFDLFLTDIQMPGLDGVETTRIIRQDLGLTFPIVALTAHAMKGDQERYIGAGMDGYVAKPFELNELRAEIERVMTRVVPKSK
ncbi:PAS domain-containing hybrid sensor histidine kinase/response regulator [Pseudodesulfovibrio sediminis]|uniref:histidine kinase n=1 Tax=Pseudodesulfovibrio sediminis TaxID=2810563 RepID=A0ABM7P8C3_9BACT|nr:PAS domain-containing hybrid sensor histidine kinase/response regulator [Pseudodesulfovibrio sediminis]BCS89226.1 hypothetical protein PSDVSF_24680 [Pseudodesulfovibrio sediminis]